MWSDIALLSFIIAGLCYVIAKEIEKQEKGKE